MSIRLAEGAAEDIARHHDKASAALADTAATMPSVPDAGLGGEYVAAIVAAVATTASDISVFNQVLGAKVREVGSAYAGTEAEVAAVFRGMTGALEP